MELLVNLNDRVERLVRKYLSLQEEHVRLQEQIAAQQSEIARLKQELGATGERLLAVQIGQGLTDEKEKQRLKQQLDKLIADIDHLLISLND